MPIPGALLTAGIGAAANFAGSLFGSKKKKRHKKVSTLSPEAQALYNDYIASIRGEGPFSDLYNFDAEGYNKVFDQSVARPAYRNFQENIIPGITGQYRQNNLMNSSYSAEALSRAGRNVQENLDAQRAQNVFAGQQQSNLNKQNAINNVLNTQTQAYLKPGEQKPGIVDQVLNSVAPAAGDWFADYLRRSKSPTAPAQSPVI